MDLDATSGDPLAAILHVVRERTGLDFACHRPPTVRRRVQNRMASLGIARMEDYLHTLAGSRDEAERLVERLTIKVSRMYRNAPAFDVLRETVLPSLPGPVRIWCAGCGRGEEAFTLAMLLEEAGVEGSVMATDIDGAALAAGSAGLYDVAATAELPPELSRHLAPEGPRQVRVSDAVHARVRFRWHDLGAGPLRGEAFELVSCRNVLIYLQRPAQERAFASLTGALAPGGFLLLGEAEWAPPSAAARVAPLDRRARIFRRTP
jgi:chemotaxis methyl-accepting protein methylase